LLAAAPPSPVSAWGACDGDESPTAALVSKVGVASPRSLERLRAVGRMLRDAVEVVEAVDEDELIKATLRQHQLALRTREQAEAQSEQESKLMDGVRRDVMDLERSMLRSQRAHRRLGVDGPAQRLGEFERQRTSVEGVHSHLSDDLHTVTDSLTAQRHKNGDADEFVKQICQARDIARGETSKANQLLGPGQTLELYRKSKEREKVAADTDLAAAIAECKAEIARLNEGWTHTEAHYTAKLQRLRAEVRREKQMKDESSREADRELAKQSSQWSKCAEDMGDQIASGVKALEDLRGSKVRHLQREVLHSRQLEREMASGTQRRLEAQVNELKLQCKCKLKMEELRLGDEVTAGRRSVEAARKSADIWGKRLEVTRESFKAHAYKSGAYVLAMDATPRKASKSRCSTGTPGKSRCSTPGWA